MQGEMTRRTEREGEPLESVSKEIVIRSRKGDRDAFRDLVETHQGYAFRLAFRLLWDEELSKDTVQETFLRVWQNRHRLDPDRRFTTWLYQIVTRLCYDRIRSEVRYRKRIDTAATDPSVSWYGQVSAEEEESNRELAGQIRRLAETLSPKQREVFILRDLEDRSIKEVARITGMSRGSVKSNLWHARSRIRGKIGILDKRNRQNEEV
jgi:RNA polymerase sigma-70 factor (ECF subfamily)